MRVNEGGVRRERKRQLMLMAKKRKGNRIRREIENKRDSYKKDKKKIKRERGYFIFSGGRRNIPSCTLNFYLIFIPLPHTTSTLTLLSSSPSFNRRAAKKERRGEGESYHFL